MPKKKQEKIAIYQAKNGAIELNIDKNKDTIWASQADIAQVFGVERSVVSKHIRNTIKQGELDEKSVCAKIAHTASDGKTYQINIYNLDVILSVGYRANSKQAVSFRKWATKILREYTLGGYAINPKTISKNYDKFLRAVEDIKKLLPESNKISAQDTMELVKLFAGTWFSLDAYDKDELPIKGVSKKKIKVSSDELVSSIEELKVSLVKKKEATDLFARERGKNSLEGVLGNVYQSFGGKEMYPSLEEKAVHLLYFLLKNHPFADGNKRSGVLRLSGF